MEPENKVTVFKPIFNINLFLFVLIYLSIILFHSDELHSQSKGKYDSLLNIYYSTEHLQDTNKVKLLYEMAVVAANEGIQDKVGKKGLIYNAEGLRIEALNLSKKLNYTLGFELYYQALAKNYNQSTDLPVLGLTDNYLGISKTEFKDYFLYKNRKHLGSLDSYLRAIEELKSKKINYHSYKIYYWIGLVYFDWNNYDKAIHYFQNAINDKEIDTDTITLSEIFQCLGVSFFYKSIPDSSKYYFKKALVLLENTHSYKEAGISCLNLGEVYSAESSDYLALDYFQKALLSISKTSDSMLLAFAQIQIGKTYIKLKQTEISKRVLNKSLNLSQTLKDKTILVKNYMLLGDVYSESGDYKTAHGYLQKAALLNDSLLINDISKFYNTSEENWQNSIGREISKKETEALKKGETTIALNKSKLYLILLGFCVIAGIIISVYTYRLYRLKNQANVYLTELSQSKEKLLSIISHDVRGPLAGFIDLLEPLNAQIQHLTHQEISSHLLKITDFAQSIKLLVDNLLEWTKAQNGLISYQPESFSLYEIVKPNLDIYEHIAKSKEIGLNCFIPEELKIFADRNMMQIVIRNLINNAIKFSGKEGMITIDYSKGESEYLISVADSGVGISKELLSILFHESQQINDEKFRLRKSSGLGLVLCKEYIGLCGGKIWAESKGINAGSTFFFSVKSANDGGQN